MAEDLRLDFNTSLQILGRCSLIRYLISKTSKKDLRKSRVKPSTGCQDPLAIFVVAGLKLKKDSVNGSVK